MLRLAPQGPAYSHVTHSAVLQRVLMNVVLLLSGGTFHWGDFTRGSRPRVEMDKCLCRCQSVFIVEGALGASKVRFAAHHGPLRLSYSIPSQAIRDSAHSPGIKDGDLPDVR